MRIILRRYTNYILITGVKSSKDLETFLKENSPVLEAACCQLTILTTAGYVRLLSQSTLILYQYPDSTILADLKTSTLNKRDFWADSITLSNELTRGPLS
jgi:hypothetical protein